MCLRGGHEALSLAALVQTFFLQEISSFFLLLVCLSVCLSTIELLRSSLVRPTDRDLLSFFRVLASSRELPYFSERCFFSPEKLFGFELTNDMEKGK